MAPLSQSDLQERVNKAVSLIQSQQHSEALDILLRLEQGGNSFAGLSYLKACSYLQLDTLHLVLSELKKELHNFGEMKEAVDLVNQIESAGEQNSTLSGLKLNQGKFIVSGLKPGSSGTGRFFETLVPVAKESGYHPIYPATEVGFSLAERVIIASIQNSQVIVLHPQTLGFSTVRSVAEGGNQLSFYVLDNSFFCIRSLNYRPQQAQECLDCVGNLHACHSSCQPFPASTSREKNLEFLTWLQKEARQFRFFCQTEHQLKLLHRHFGDVQGSVIGMRTDEFHLTEDGLQFDVVFHGEALDAKGMSFVVDLARELPSLQFLLPVPAESWWRELERNGRTDFPSPTPNLTVKDMRWNTGLKDHIAACKLVLCPSLWSAPVEGALLKSLFYNGNVAVAESEYGFEREIPKDLLLRLSRDVKVAAGEVKSFLASGICNREKSREWVNSYREKVDLSKIFSFHP